MTKKSNVQKLAEATAKYKKLSDRREHIVDTIMIPLEIKMDKAEELIDKIKKEIEKENKVG